MAHSSYTVKLSIGLNDQFRQEFDLNKSNKITKFD